MMKTPHDTKAHDLGPLSVVAVTSHEPCPPPCPSPWGPQRETTTQSGGVRLGPRLADPPLRPPEAAQSCRKNTGFQTRGPRYESQFHRRAMAERSQPLAPTRRMSKRVSQKLA